MCGLIVQADSNDRRKGARLGVLFAIAVMALDCGPMCFGQPAETEVAVDRTTMLVPLDPEAEPKEPPSGLYPDQAFFGSLATASSGSDASGLAERHRAWTGYLEIWKAHHRDPADLTIRRFLGLPLRTSAQARAVRGRSSPRFLRWKSGSFAQIDTPHFVIYSRAAREPSMRLAEDLERCYWVWTQMFFPLWESNAQVTSILRDWSDDQSISEFLEQKGSRITQRRKLRIVLFRDANEYRRTLAPEIPGIEQSTGFYDHGKQTVFLYADDRDDAATRRHELVHQFFREATRSALGRSMPGQQQGFWLIEGIAGYFESLWFTDRSATVGGWDSPRLQFARYRVLVGQDEMSLRELVADGQSSAQQRSDLARWYSHAIARTHQLVDGGDDAARRWVYDQLADLYRVPVRLDESRDPSQLDALDGGLRTFLVVDDQHLLANPVARPLKQLVLAGCRVTEQGLASLPASPHMQWLDCARLPVGNQAIVRLAPTPADMKQLTLEATRIDDGIADWLRQAHDLQELDLSFTTIGDPTIEAIAGAKRLLVLWMTGTKVSDRSIDTIVRFRQLESIDLQRTAVTDQGLKRLREALPDVDLNPLQLR